MKPLHSTIINLAGRHVSSLHGSGKTGASQLQEITGFGLNPGALRAWTHVPAGLRPGAPLVVVLHGCTQTAADYDAGAGWSQLADELGFVLLLPEQQRSNNPNLCFNWFSPIDSRRDSGEALSIRQMIAWLAETHEIDAQSVFVTGLSAGGAMASIMLAVYPELFAGGAIIAGLPYGAAASVGDAFSRMAGQGYPEDAVLASLVRDASAHDGPWPRIAVWQGSADYTVSPSNADRVIAQWSSLHGVDSQAFKSEQFDRHTRRTWRNGESQAVLELNIINGMGHGTPLKTHAADACGKPGPYMLEVGISSTRAIAHFWGLGDTAQEQASAPIDARIATVVPPEPIAVFHLATAAYQQMASGNHKGVGAIIEDALRAAGLMK